MNNPLVLLVSDHSHYSKSPTCEPSGCELSKMWTYYKPITVQHCSVDWVSWAPRLTLLDLPTNWTLHVLSEQNSLVLWGLNCTGKNTLISTIQGLFLLRLTFESCLPSPTQNIPTTVAFSGPTAQTHPTPGTSPLLALVSSWKTNLPSGPCGNDSFTFLYSTV